MSFLRVVITRQVLCANHNLVVVVHFGLVMSSFALELILSTVGDPPTQWKNRPFLKLEETLS